MIYLYYTGSDQFNYPQIEASKSLGGFISSSLISNQSINNLFGSISNFTLQKNTSDIRIIAIKNSLNIDILNFKFYYTINIDSKFDYEFSFVKPTEDKCNNLFFEKLLNSESSPYYATFSNPKDLIGQINLNTFDRNSYLGLFIKRKIKNSISQNNLSNSCQAINSNNLFEVENLSLNFSWD